MTTYIVVAVALALIILALRRYFGKKYAASCGSRCSSCPYAKSCRQEKQIKD